MVTSVRRFFIMPQHWAGMSRKQQDDAVLAMLAGCSPKTCTTTNGQLTVVKPTSSKKPGQRKRGIAERSRTPKKAKRSLAFSEGLSEESD